jgi:hypothetical protein
VISDGKIFALSKSISFQSLGPGEDGIILLIDCGDILTCNDTTSAFLRSLDGNTTFGEAVNALANEFEVEHVILRSDLEKLATSLAERGIIV